MHCLTGGICLFVGIAIFSGLYRFGKALDSCVEHILNQKGSRMQQELANMYVLYPVY